MSLIVLYFLHSSLVLSFNIDVVLTLSIRAWSFSYQNPYLDQMSAVPPKVMKLNHPLTHLYQNPTTWTGFAALQSVDIIILRCQCEVCTILYAFQKTRCRVLGFNTLRPRQNGRHFLDDTFKCIFLNENIWIFRSTCKLIQSLFLQWFVKLMGPSLFLRLLFYLVFS